MKCLKHLDSYWNISEPVRLDPVTDEVSNRKALFFGLKIVVLATAILILFLFLGLML